MDAVHFNKSPRIIVQRQSPFEAMAEGFIGAPGKARTCNLRVRSAMLYPLSYGRVRARSYSMPSVAFASSRTAPASFFALFITSTKVPAKTGDHAGG
jgi:hypothetical protein